MMLHQMDGEQMISIGAVIRKAGLLLSLRQLRASSLVDSQKLNGNPQVSLSPVPTRSCSV
jgi:hypothetical protein